MTRVEAIEQQSNELFRLLLLEDEQPLRESLARLIAPELPGTTIIQAGTIIEALDCIDQGPIPTLGVLDIRVPMKPRCNDDSNPEVAKRLRELGVPCIFMTGYRKSDDVEKFLESHYLTSPNVIVIEKILKEGYLTSAIIRHAKQLFTELASKKVRAAVHQLFEDGNIGSHSTTAGWIQAERLIRAYWDYLNKETRDLVRKWVVVESPGPGKLTFHLFDRKGNS